MADRRLLAVNLLKSLNERVRGCKSLTRCSAVASLRNRTRPAKATGHTLEGTAPRTPANGSRTAVNGLAPPPFYHRKAKDGVHGRLMWAGCPHKPKGRRQAACGMGMEGPSRDGPLN